ncbi:hypothetical protein LTR17_013228 [Elasticomyces elasticus]|nr:hypothetical protein LTR17_013228 [Elasticomyces elasticus]
MSAKLLWQLKLSGIDDVALMPMDGFHHPKAILAAFDDPATAFRRRGAPYTFDARAFVDAVRALRAVPVMGLDDPLTEIRIPSFDHAL